MFKKIFALGAPLLFVFALMLSSQSVQALSCAYPGTNAEFLSGGGLIFAGTVTSNNSVGSAFEFDQTVDKRQVAFNATSIWGASQINNPFVVIDHVPPASDLGDIWGFSATFDVGKKYVVYATLENGEYRANVGACARSQAWNADAEARLNSELGAATTIKNPVVPVTPTPISNPGGSFTDSLLAQIQSLLALVASLQQQLAEVTDGTPTAPVVTDFASCVAAGNLVMESYPRQCAHGGRTYVEKVSVSPVPPVSISCPDLRRNLAFGMRGDDVSGLQRYLLSAGHYDYPEITGYFGGVTQRAVQSWQRASGVVLWGTPETTGYGVAGPATRKAILAACGGTTPIEPIACTLEYAPVCGVKGVTEGPRTYGNSCQLKVAGAQYLYDGECRDASSEAPSSCKVWYDGCNTCSRTTPGGPMACTLRACIWQDTPTCKEYFPGNLGQPIIHSFSGPTVLSVNETGTWEVKASDPESGSLLYNVDWGDTVSFSDAAAASLQQQAFVQTTTFRYAYTRAGTYKVTMTVRDETGLTNTTTTTVRVTSETTVGTTFSASPKSGTAPLAVVFKAPGGLSCTDGPDYQIDYGDGSARQMTPQCSHGQHSMTHTYVSEGTYVATLFRIPSGFGPAPIDRTPVAVATQVITVGGGGPTVCTAEYAPVCGLPAFCSNLGPNEAACSQSVHAQTFSNRCQLDAAGATFLYTGACLPTYAGPTCTSDGQTFTEGAKLQCITLPGSGFNSCVADASYVCRNGEWKIEGSNWGRTCSDQSENSTYGGAYYEQCLNPTDPTTPSETVLSVFEPSSSSSYRVGDSIFVRWTSNVTLSNLGMYIVLEDDVTGRQFVSKKVDSSAGFATLDTGRSCNQFFSDGIDGDCSSLKSHINKGHFTFRVRAAYFTPGNACLGFCAPGSPTPSVVSESVSAPFSLGL